MEPLDAEGDAPVMAVSPAAQECPPVDDQRTSRPGDRYSEEEYVIDAIDPAIRDRLWLWGHEAGSQNWEWNLPRESRITPVEAAVYLGIPNLMMVKYNGLPVMPYDQVALPMRGLRRVAWSLTGARGESSAEEREHVLALAAATPNITGLVLDDFINWDTGEPELSPEQLADIGARCAMPDGRRLDRMMILYTHQLDADLAAHLPHVNQVSLWVWHARDLPGLPDALARLEQLAPAHSRFVGCYLWDMGPRAPMPLDAFQRQVEQSLGWLEDGRIAGVIFLASSMCDIGLPTVEWLRERLSQAP